MFIERLREQIKRYELLKKDEKVIVGVSGGPDSMALLHSLCALEKEIGFKILAVHVNHQLRGKESEEDEQYVRTFCSREKIPLEVVRVDVKGELRKKGGNLQQVARQLRMDSFAWVARNKGINKLALAHHADDQVETILMRLLRGTGPTGLVGMEPMRKWKELLVIRPFLSFSRKEIEDYCENHQLHPRIDSSNASVQYMRNRIRLELIPYLHKYNPQFREALLGLSEIIYEEEKVWSTWVQKAYEQIKICQDPNRIVLDVSSFLHLPIALQRRIVKLILSYLWNEENYETTLDSIDRVRCIAEHENPSAKADLPGKISVNRAYDQLIISRCVNLESKDVVGSKMIPLRVPGMSSLPGFLGKIEVIQSSSPLSAKDLRCDDWVVFDKDLLQGPFYARSRKPGDRMYCFRMEGRKKLKDLFMEARIPKHLRDRYPILVQNDTILWVPKVRRSSFAPVTKNTKNFLYFLWHVEETFVSSE